MCSILQHMFVIIYIQAEASEWDRNRGIQRRSGLWLPLFGRNGLGRYLHEDCSFLIHCHLRLQHHHSRPPTAAIEWNPGQFLNPGVFGAKNVPSPGSRGTLGLYFFF